MQRPFRVGMVFLLISASWIFLSDLAVLSLAGDLESMRTAQTLKGWLYVGLATLLVVYLARRELASARREREALRLSEERFRRAVEEAPFPAMLHADDGEILALSRSWTELTGYDRSHLRTMEDWTTRAYGEDRPAVEADIRALYAAPGRSDEGEFRVTAADGETRTWDFSSVSLDPLPDGRRLVISMAVDVTDRVAREEALRLSEERYRHLFDRAPLPLWIFDQESLAFLEVNKAAIQRYGYSREEFLDMTVADIRPPSERERLMESVGSEPGLHRAGVWTHLTREGSPIQVEITAYPIDFQGRPAEFVMATDVTTRQEIHEALREGRRTYEQLFRNTHAVMLVLDPEDGSLVDANPAAARFYGYTVAQLRSMRISDLNTADPRLLRQRMGEAHAGQVHFSQLRHRLADGSERDVEAYAGPVRLGGRDVLLAIIHDVSDQAETRRQLEHAQRMEMVGRLAGGVAHDFNNLLAVMRNTAELAAWELDPGHPVQTDLRDIVEATHRGEHLTRQLLTFSRKQVTRPEVLDLNDALRGMAGGLQRLLGEDLALALELTGEPTRVYMDAGQLEQVVLNLAVNARDALDDGGTLRMTTRVESGRDDVDRVVLEVEDDGPGIPEEIRESIFDPFFTTKEMGRGTGLGLSTVFGIVEQARGHIELDRGYPEGARFVIHLPRIPGSGAPAPRRAEETPPAPPTVPAGSLDGWVLVVEDDETVRRVTERILARIGCETRAVATAEEALEAVGTQGPRASLVISDVVLPGMDGPTLLEELRSVGWSGPAILTSGYRPEDIDPVPTELMSSVRFLEKPFTADELLAEVRLALGGR